MYQRTAGMGQLQDRSRSAGTVGAVPATTAETLRVPDASIAVLAIATAIAAVIVGWLLAGSHGSSTPASVAVGPTLVSAEELGSEAKSLGHPIYWAGPAERLVVRADGDGQRARLRPLPAARAPLPATRARASSPSARIRASMHIRT